MDKNNLSAAARMNIEHGDWWEEAVPLHKHSLYRKIDATMRAIPPGRVIELGCGSGRYLDVLRSRGWDVMGVELAPQTADYIMVADLSQPLTLAPDFDVVVSAETIEHVVDTDRFLRTCAGLLKPGGRLILTTPNLLFGVNRLRMLFGVRPAFAYADFHVRMFVWSDLKHKIERHFVIDGVRGSHVLIGVRRTALAEVFSMLGDWLPKLSAHFIVVAHKRTPNAD